MQQSHGLLAIAKLLVLFLGAVAVKRLLNGLNLSRTPTPMVIRRSYE